MTLAATGAIDGAMRLDGTRVRGYRHGAGMTQGELAKAAATSLRNVQRAEAGDDISPQMAQFFADALGRDLAELVAQGSLPGRQRTADRLARLAVRTPPTPPKKGDVEEFDSRALADTYSAPGAQLGRNFVATVRVTGQRAISRDEAAALRAPHGVGAAFAASMPVDDREDLALTFHTAAAATTRALQERWPGSARVWFRVVLTEDEPPFAFFESSRLHDWTYAVTKVEAAEAPETAKRDARARKRAAGPDAKARRLR